MLKLRQKAGNTLPKNEIRMRKNYHSKVVSVSPLNTLAENGTKIYQSNIEKPGVIVNGTGSELGNDKFLKSRAKKKLISATLALNFISIADKKEDHEKKQSFWNTYHCQNRLYIVDGKLHGKYCKNRFCTICSGNRKADIINRYLPTVKGWKEPYFLTLTVKSCKAENLKVMIEWVMLTFERIYQKLKKRNQRGKGIKITGIKSLECEFNPVSKTYNPHLHLVVASKEIAETLKREWISIWKERGKRFVTWKAQKSEAVYNLESALVEIIKYGTKIFTPSDVDNKSMNIKGGNINAAAMYNIIAAMKGVRIFERFGFNLLKETKQVPGSKVAGEYSEWKYTRKYSDWHNTENELQLTGYIAPVPLVNLLKYNIDLQLE